MTQGTVHDIKNTFEIEFSTELIQGEISVESHFHMNTEIIAVEEGEIAVTVNGNEYIASSGQVAIILPFRIHSLVAGKGAKIRRTTIGENLGIAFLYALPTTNPSSPVFTPNGDTMRFHLDFLSREFGNEYVDYSYISPPTKRIMAKSIIYALGSEFIESTEFVSDTSSDNFISIIQQMTKYISDNYTEDISRASMAEAFGYNPQYLSRKIKNTLGINFNKMLNQHRINHAYRLIVDTDKPYADIAFESGFQSIRTFNQVFLDTYRKTPRELREDLAKYNKTHR